MAFSIRDSEFDIAVVAGPRIQNWPSIGARTLSTVCSEMGFKVGLFGGDSISARGVLPLPVTGGLVLLEDSQHRIHRIAAKSVVRLTSEEVFPDTFPGWRSQGLIPLSTAIRLRDESKVVWDPCTVILGTGNSALRFGSSLLDSGVREVFCVESYAQWGAKRFAGWEVERRRFETAGGKILEAQSVELSLKAPLLWEFRLRDSRGVRVVDVARVVSAGPYRDTSGIKEYPPGSFLFELDLTASENREDDVLGWRQEEERARWLAAKITRSLGVGDFESNDRDKVERHVRKAKWRLRQIEQHRISPFTPSYDGKWTRNSDMKVIRNSIGVPKKRFEEKPIASIECFENIPCDRCEKVCPESAIEIDRAKGKFLIEDKCTGCGLCVSGCPSNAISLIESKKDASHSRLTLPWRGRRKWKEREFAQLLNRRGDLLGTARISAVIESESANMQLVQVDTPSHLLWEARGLRPVPAKSTEDEAFLAMNQAESRSVPKVPITLNGERRLVRDQITVATALFETGYARAEDVLMCPDGSCGLCQFEADGTKKLACQERIHKGMAIQLRKWLANREKEEFLCPCARVTENQVLDRLEQGKLQSPEAVLTSTKVGEGKCHGLLCTGALRRLLLDHGLDVKNWVDWRFPWRDWEIRSGPRDAKERHPI